MQPYLPTYSSTFPPRSRCFASDLAKLTQKHCSDCCCFDCRSHINESSKLSPWSPDRLLTTLEWKNTSGKINAKALHKYIDEVTARGTVRLMSKQNRGFVRYCAPLFVFLRRFSVLGTRSAVSSFHINWLFFAWKRSTNVDNLDPNLPLGCVVHDQYHTDPTQETCARSFRLCVFHPAS